MTRDQEEALSLSNNIVVMEHGKIIQIGILEEIYYNPKNVYVASFVGKSNFIKEENGASYILRPEDIKLRKNPNGKYAIEELMFLGDKTEVTLTHGKNKIEAQLIGIVSKYLVRPRKKKNK